MEKSTWFHFKYMLRRKETYESVGYSNHTFCDCCHKPAKIYWIKEAEGVGHGEAFYDGMHLACWKECHFGQLPKIFALFLKDNESGLEGAIDL